MRSVLRMAIEYSVNVNQIRHSKYLTTFFTGNTKLADQQGRVPDPIKHGNLTWTIRNYRSVYLDKRRIYKANAFLDLMNSYSSTRPQCL